MLKVKNKKLGVRLLTLVAIALVSSGTITIIVHALDVENAPDTARTGSSSTAEATAGGTLPANVDKQTGGTSSAQGKPAPSATPTKENDTVAVKPSNTTDRYQITEQFTGNTLDNGAWQVMTYPKGYRNKEEQRYDPAQVKVQNGMLQISATRDMNGEWVSGEVHSRWNFTYGEFEVRLALSTTGPGVWPAAWLMGTSPEWPNNGELDIFENINGEQNVYGTIHGGGFNGHWQLQRYVAGIDVRQFHVYKIIKAPGTVSWWVDGIKRGEWTPSHAPAGSTWPFDSHSNFALLNLAIGGNWPGPSNAGTPSDIKMMVDYVSVKNGS
jgi:hypothetical protein